VIYEIINDAAQAYNGVIPPDCWKEPYMSKGELRHEMDAGVAFWGYEEDGQLIGVMGIQHVPDHHQARLCPHVSTTLGHQGNCCPIFELKRFTRFCRHLPNAICDSLLKAQVSIGSSREDGC
jgi:hypothetical protein